LTPSLFKKREMADMKLANWTKPTTGTWPGVITTDKYIETITMGSGTGEFNNLTAGSGASRQDCTLADSFIRVFKIQPAAHKLVIQLHLTTALVAASTDARIVKLGAFGTIDETTEDALWSRIPDQGIGAAISQHDLAESGSTKTNMTYNPFGVLTTSVVDSQQGQFDHVGFADSTDLSTTTDDLHFLPGGAASTSVVGHYAQYVLHVDQLCYDYVAIRLSTNSTAASTAGAYKFIVRQFN